jgi:hypothetical protein
MKPRDTHADLFCDISDAQGLGELFPQFVHRPNHAMRVTANRGETAHAVSLFAQPRAMYDAHDWWLSALKVRSENVGK